MATATAKFPADNEVSSMGTTDAGPAHLLMKIESFSLLSERGIQKYESNQFTAGDYKWRLIIYPRIKNDNDHIAVYLDMVDTSSLPVDWEVNVIFNIFLYNQISDNYLCFQGKQRRFNAMKSRWGFTKLISKKRFTDPSNGLLVDDNCFFGCEVFVSKSQRVVDCLSVVKVASTYTHACKISNFSELKDVWSSEKFTAGGRQWTIQLYPNGSGPGSGKSVSIYLYANVAVHEKVKASFCLRIKNQLNSKHWSSQSSAWFDSSKSGWGFNASIPVADTRDPNKGFVVNDCCLVEAEIVVQAVASNTFSPK